MIYAMRAGDSGPIKIGFASDLKSRRRNVQTAHWQTVYLLRAWIGDVSDERPTQAIFRAKHVRGECFDISEADLALITLPVANVDCLGGCEDTYSLLDGGKREWSVARRKAMGVGILEANARLVEQAAA